MADLRVDISAHLGGWRFQWHQDGAPVGGPVDVSAHDASQLGSLSSAIAQAFEHRSADGFGRLPLVHTAALDDIGRQLRDNCCKPITEQLANGAGEHRLTVVSDEPPALNLPWELLPVGGDDEWLGCDKRWGVFRTPADAKPPPPVQRGGPLRILFLAAAPTDQPALDYEKEEEAILRATATLQGALLFTAELGTYKELADELLPRVKPHIVHLSGHGAVRDRVGWFCFEDDAGHTDARAADELARLFAQRNVPCVFLNGCQTSQADVAGLCQALTAAGLPLALGWAANVADERAIAFAETFYRELLGGEPVPAAAALARLRIQREGIHRQTPGRGEEQELTFLLPQLYAARPVEVLFDPREPNENFKGVETRYERLPAGVPGLREGFVGRRREMQLAPALRKGDKTFLLLHGAPGQGKSTLATRLVDRLREPGLEVRAVVSRRQEGEAAASCAIRAGADVVKEISGAAKFLNRSDLAAILEGEKDPLLRMTWAADVLAKLKCVLVLDNFEDVMEAGPDGVWRIVDTGLREFYGRVQTQLTSAKGGRIVVTSRYVPEGTHVPEGTRCVKDFKYYEFVKLLKRDDRVAQRIYDGELPMSLLGRLYAFAGGTPRFLERLRTLLLQFSAEELEKALDAGGGVLANARDKYLEDHFGPQLWARLTDATRCLLRRLGLSDWPLPKEEVLEKLTGLDGVELDAAVKQGVEFGLLQVFEETDPTLYLPYGVWRGWLAERLTGDERTAAHGVLAAFWRAEYEEGRKDRLRELRVSVIDGLQACRVHAKDAGNRELRSWASVQLSRWWELIGAWRAARSVLAEIPEGERDGDAWHALAIIDEKEGKYTDAREKFGKALVIEQQSGDRAGEASTWHNLGTVDLHERNYVAAREKFAKSLAITQQTGHHRGAASIWFNLAEIDMREGNHPAAREKCSKASAIMQRIGDRRGEAAGWHQLASIDLREGKYAAGREKFAKALMMRQQSGDRAGEAATWNQLASIDIHEGKYAAAREKFGKALMMRQQIGDRPGEANTWSHLASIDMHEGKYAAAREKFGKALGINQQVGDHPGEAAGFFQLGIVAAQEKRLLPAAKLVGACFIIDQAIGHGDAQQDLGAFLGICAKLELTELQERALLEEIAKSYLQDRGVSLLKEAFPDWQLPVGRAWD